MTLFTSSSIRFAGFFAVAIIWATSRPASAQTLFQQTFETSTSLNDYVHSSSPDTGQFNGINAGTGNTAAVLDGALMFTRTAAANGAFWRTTELAPVPTAVRVQFDLNVTGNVAAQTGTGLSNGVSLYLGEGFTAGASSGNDNGANTVARLNIGWTATSGEWTLYRGSETGASPLQTSLQTVNWYVNSSAGDTSYQGPDGASHSLAGRTYDVWIGQTAMFTSVAATGTETSLAEFKFRWDSAAANATITFDNLSISAIPEPSTYAVFGGAAALLFGFVRRVRARDSSPTLRA